MRLSENLKSLRKLIRFIKGNKLLQFFKKKDRTDDYLTKEMVKLQRAQGECLGTKSRRRT